MANLLPKCWRNTFNVLPKIKDDNSIWLTVGDALDDSFTKPDGVLLSELWALAKKLLII